MANFKVWLWKFETVVNIHSWAFSYVYSQCISKYISICGFSNRMKFMFRFCARFPVRLFAQIRNIFLTFSTWSNSFPHNRIKFCGKPIKLSGKEMKIMQRVHWAVGEAQHPMILIFDDELMNFIVSSDAAWFFQAFYIRAFNKSSFFKPQIKRRAKNHHKKCFA